MAKREVKRGGWIAPREGGYRPRGKESHAHNGANGHNQEVRPPKPTSAGAASAPAPVSQRG